MLVSGKFSQGPLELGTSIQQTLTLCYGKSVQIIALNNTKKVYTLFT